MLMLVIKLNRFLLITSSYLGRKRYIPLCFTELPPSPGYKLMKFSEERAGTRSTPVDSEPRDKQCVYLLALLQPPALRLPSSSRLPHSCPDYFRSIASQRSQYFETKHDPTSLLSQFRNDSLLKIHTIKYNI